MPTSALICSMPRWHAYWKFTRRWELATIAAVVNTTCTCCQMRLWKPSVIVDAWNVDIVALGCRQTSGHSRRRATQRRPASWHHALTTSGCNCSKHQTHPGQHRIGAAAVQPPDVCCTTACWTRIFSFPAGDYRWGPEAAVAHTTQDVAAACPACLSTEGLRGCLCTGHHHTCQLVTANRKVPSTLQVSAGAAATDEGGARQVIASQLQADI